MAGSTFTNASSSGGRGDGNGEAMAKPPRDLSYRFSRVARMREASEIKHFYKFFLIPGIRNLAGGLPNASFFPYDTLEAQTALPNRFDTSFDETDVLSENTNRLSISKNKKKDDSTTASSHLIVPHASTTTNPLQRIDLTTALQYGTAQGYPPLYSFLRQFTLENLHPNIPYRDADGIGGEIILTDGATDGLAKVLETLSNPWTAGRDSVSEREGMLCEEFAYMNAIQAARPRGLNIVPVRIDSEGMLPSGRGGLEDVLENWDESKGKRPHLMYTVTVGQNPTSGTLSLQRRKEIYALCSKYDVIIIEDDPYFCLQYPDSAEMQATARGQIQKSQRSQPPVKSSGYAFLDSLVQSSLNIDVDGRVIRLDTFSKTIAPGCRLGWITAQPAIIERILRLTEVSTQQPSGFVQSMVAELIMGPQTALKEEFSKKSKKEQSSFTGWSTHGWVRWLEGLRTQYQIRMTTMCTVLEEGRFMLKQKKSTTVDGWAVISKTEMYTFEWPQGGMFIWVQVFFKNHPLAGTFKASFLSRALWVYLTHKPYLVLLAPGTIFSPTAEIKEVEGWRYFRLCFAAVKGEEVELFSKRFVEGVEDFFKIKDWKVMKEIGKEAEESRYGGEDVADLSMPWGY